MCIFDFFGTDDFWNNHPNPYDKIVQEADWFANNAWEEFSAPADTWKWRDYKPVVSDDDVCGDANGNDTNRRDEANNWLISNFPYYDSSDGCIVLDYEIGESFFGCAYVNGLNNVDQKTALIDYGTTSSELPAYDTNGIGIRHYLGMEPGHLYGAKHPRDGYITIFDEVTFMFDNEGADCGTHGSASTAISDYSSCAETVIEDTINKVC